MSENNSYWTNLTEKIIGIVIIIISAIMLYYTATTDLGTANWMFGILGAAILITGILLLIIKPSSE